MIVGDHFDQDLARLCGQFAAAVDVLADLWMRSLKTDLQATLERGHVLEHDVVEIPTGGGQQDRDLRSQWKRLVGGLREHGPQPFATLDLASTSMPKLAKRATSSNCASCRRMCPATARMAAVCAAASPRDTDFATFTAGFTPRLNRSESSTIRMSVALIRLVGM